MFFEKSNHAKNSVSGSLSENEASWSASDLQWTTIRLCSDMLESSGSVNDQSEKKTLPCIMIQMKYLKPGFIVPACSMPHSTYLVTPVFGTLQNLNK